ncbi:hypothetical protein QZH41_001055 [Actinostola sp. cb2023]|nr:hypothetical protein QZH41_001055 [Actinostola sp. cb2023]
MNETLLFGGGGKKKKKRKSLNEEDAWYQSYFQPGKPHPYALDGSTSWTFYESAKERKPKETLKEKENQMRQWLESQTTYALHRPAPKKYPRRPFVVNFMDEFIGYAMEPLCRSYFGDFNEESDSQQTAEQNKNDRRFEELQNFMVSVYCKPYAKHVGAITKQKWTLSYHGSKMTAMDHRNNIHQQ